MLKLRVGALMKARGITEKEMYDRTGIARNSIRTLMRGSNTRIDLFVLERIARELGVSPLELFDATDEPRGQRVPARVAAATP
jgi:putative transcriptional regulator